MDRGMNRLSDLTAQCIRCGFCLESCPTFSETGEEPESPRGRIYLVRSAVEGSFDWIEGIKPHLDGCLGCRACETACPSGVKYGEILEEARAEIERRAPERKKKWLLDATSRPGVLRAQLQLSRLLPGRRLPRLLSPSPSETDKPSPQAPAGWPPLDESALPTPKGEVRLLEGCAMRVLFPRVHEATRRLLRRVGYTVRKGDFGCCGALHAHNGYLDEGRSMRAKVPDDLPIVVDSAGCGSWLKDGKRPAVDVSEFLFAEGLVQRLAESHGLEITVAYHDACHLAHGQGVRQPPRDLLAAIPRLRLEPLAESDTCCGSAGIYNIAQPKMARRLLERKWRHIEESGADVVALGNPGCHAWIAQAAREKKSAVRVFHTAELLEAAFSGLPRD